MAWLRIDDGFASHPKITSLSDRELRVWLRVLCYAARYQTKGYLTPEQRGEIVGLTDALTGKLVRNGLLDEEGQEGPLLQGVLYIHDFHIYDHKNTNAERARRYRNTRKSRNASRDEPRDDERDATRDSSRARAAPYPSPTPYIQETAPLPEPSPNQGRADTTAFPGFAEGLARGLAEAEAEADTADKPNGETANSNGHHGNPSDPGRLDITAATTVTEAAAEINGTPVHPQPADPDHPHLSPEAVEGIRRLRELAAGIGKDIE